MKSHRERSFPQIGRRPHASVYDATNHRRPPPEKGSTLAPISESSLARLSRLRERNCAEKRLPRLLVQLYRAQHRARRTLCCGQSPPLPHEEHTDMSLIIPAIKYEQCRSAIDWLCTVFGFEAHFIVEGPGDQVAHAQLTLGEHMIMVGSTDRSEFGVLNIPPGHVGGKVTTSLYVCVEDPDIRFAHIIAAGAEIAVALQEEDHGGKSFSCRDIEGHLWTFGSYNPWTQ